MKQIFSALIFVTLVLPCKGSTGSDSTSARLVSANIVNSDTTICQGSSIRLYADSTLFPKSACSVSDLPPSATSQLTNFYPFCGNANDKSGTNDGVVNGAILAPDKSGNPNSAYQFNGINNTINLAAPFLGGTQQSQFTIHARVKFNRLNNSPNIWGKTILWGEVNFQVTSDGSILFFWANSVTGNKYSAILSAPGVIAIGTWYDITVVFNSGKGQLYVNGAAIATTLRWTAQGGGFLSNTSIESTCNFAQDAGSSMFGVRINGGAREGYLDGVIDDFYVYSKAMTASEVPSLHSGAGRTKILWSTGDTTNSIIVTPTQTTTYSVTLDDGFSTCSDSVRISLTDSPSLDPTSHSVLTCLNNPMKTLAHKTNGVTAMGNASGLPAGLAATFSSNELVISGTPTVTGIFNYTIPLSGTCGNVTARGTIEIKERTPGIRYATITTEVNKEVLLAARNIGNTYSWTPPTGLSDAFIANPTARIENSLEYQARITDNAGCITVDTILIKVNRNIDIWVAGGFTPNTDGKNDRLFAFTAGLSSFKYLKIFNRWGNLIFETTSTDPAKGWDGRFNGRDQPSDVYIWMAEGIGINGTIIKKQGKTILIR